MKSEKWPSFVPMPYWKFKRVVVVRRADVEAHESVARIRAASRNDVDDARADAALRRVARAADDLQRTVTAADAVEKSLVRIFIEERTAEIDAVELIADLDARRAANRNRAVAAAPRFWMTPGAESTS